MGAKSAAAPARAAHVCVYIGGHIQLRRPIWAAPSPLPSVCLLFTRRRRHMNVSSSPFFAAILLLILSYHHCRSSFEAKLDKMTWGKNF